MPYNPKRLKPWISLPGEHPAPTSVLPELGQAWLENVPGSSGAISEWFKASVPPGSSGKTSLVFYPFTEDATLPSSFKGWQNAGMVSPTGFLTLNIGEYPSAAGASLLSDILETEVPPKYYLSRKAVQGVLNRNRRRGNLEEWLEHLLQAALDSLE